MRIARGVSIASVVLSLALSGSAAAQAGAITGQVTDAQAGTPLRDIEVMALEASGLPVSTTRSRENGQYRLGNVAPGTYTVLARIAGYSPTRIPGVTVAAGQTVNMSLTMERLAFAISEEVVVGTRGEPGKALESPNPVHAKTTERIEEQPSLVPIEQVRGMPGMVHAQTGLFSGTVVSRGFNNVFSTSLLAITDNRYTNVPSLRVNTAFLMPAVNDDVERIEVLLGPGSALYGPNAADGVMHIITKSPFRHPGTTVSFGGGERDVLTGSLRHAGTVGQRFGYKVTGQWMRGREWEFVDAGEEAARAADPTIPARDPDLRRWTGELRADYRFGEDAGAVFRNAEFVLTAGRVTAESAIELTPFGAAQAKNWRYDYYQARFAANRFFVQTFLNRSNAGNTFLLRTGEPIVDESRLIAAQIQHSTPFGRRQTFVYGIDFQRTDPRTGGTIHGQFEDDDDSNEIGGYLHSETRLSRLFDLVLAARVDNHSRVDENVFSPRAAVVYRPLENHNFRATYNRAFSTPLNSQLFLDLRAGTLGALPFELRAIGGNPGYQFRRDCTGGICVRSPFPASGEAAPSPAMFRDLDATRFWGAATSILFAQSGGQVDIRMIPPPTAQQVSTVLRLLNPHPDGAFFSTVDPESLADVAPLRPTISNTFEIGYKGIAANRVSVAVDLWRQERKDFVSAALIETPNMFLERSTLQAYLSNFMPAANAAQVAAAMAGIDGNPAATGIPLGTANWDSPFTQNANVYATYRNYGDVRLWGSDLAVEALVGGSLTLTGTYSWLSDDTFRTVDAGGSTFDVILNSPANKASAGARWTLPGGVTLSPQVRFVDGFPMNSGVYIGTVESYTVADLGVTWRIPTVRNEARLTLYAQNLLDRRHAQFVGAPEIGRLVTARVSYTLGPATPAR